MGVLRWSLFCYAVLCVLSSFATILMGMLYFNDLSGVLLLWLFLKVQWAGVQCVNVVFPDHTHFVVSPVNACVT